MDYIESTTNQAFERNLCVWIDQNTKRLMKDGYTQVSIPRVTEQIMAKIGRKMSPGYSSFVGRAAKKLGIGTAMVHKPKDGPSSGSSYRSVLVLSNENIEIARGLLTQPEPAQTTKVLW